MSYRRPYTFDRVARIFFTVCGIIALLLILDTLKGVLLPFLVSCLIAYTLEPVVLWNRKILKTRGRVVPVIITLFEITVLTVILGIVFIPYIINEAAQMGDLLKRYASATMNTPYLPPEIHEFLKENLDFNRISKLFTPEEWKEILTQAVSSSWTFLSSGLSFIIGLCSWLIVILYVIFIMIDYEKLMLSFKQLIPHTHRSRVMEVANDVRNAMHNYFRGQFLIAMIVGILFAIGFAIIDLPMGVALGLTIGVMNMVPYLQLVSLPITALLCLISSVDTGIDFWVIFWESMAVYIIVQSIQDLYLTPKIMGKAMGLNPAIILLSLSIWGCLLGFLGLIIALPLTTLILSYYDRYVVEPYRRRDRLDDTSQTDNNGSPLDTPF